MAVTKQEMIDAFAEVRILNQTVWEEFLDMFFGPTADFLPLSGGTMTGAIDMNSNEIQNAVLVNPLLGDGESLSDINGTVSIYFGGGAFGSAKLNMTVNDGLGLEGFIGITEDAVLQPNRIQIAAALLSIVGDNGMLIKAGSDLTIDSNSIAFFNGTPVGQMAALTPNDASAIGPVYDGTTEGVLNNVRQRVLELEAGFTAYALIGV